MSNVFSQSPPLISGRQLWSGKPLGFLSLTNDTAIDALLSDIPFFCIGLTAFAVFTFLLIMRRTNLLAVYLYSSALLAFVGSILDLSQLLNRGQVNIDNNTDVMTGFIIAREICYGLSVGFRGIFFWGYIAIPPPARPNGDQESASSFRLQDQNGGWARYGPLGSILKWGLLIAITAIPLLQIIWRLSKSTPAIRILALVESILEITTASLFILVIVLNALLSTSGMSFFAALQFQLVPIIALLFALSLGIGNVIMQSFSETTLGRFLQAVEMYILILFILVAAFRKTPRPDSVQSWLVPSNEPQSARIIPEKPPNPITTSSTQFVPTGPAYDTSRRQSARMSSSMAIRRFSMGSSNWRLSVPQINAEPREIAESASEIRTVNPSVASPALKSSLKIFDSSSTIDMEIALSPPGTTSRDREEFDPADIALKPSQPSRAYTDFSISMYTGDDAPLPSPQMRQEREVLASPVWGLNGIVDAPQPSGRAIETIKKPRPISSINSFDDLLRQQKELDRSIAALRLFSPRSSFASLTPSTETARPVQLERSSSSRDRLSSLKHSSASNRSDFSLSIFPEPPKLPQANPNITTAPLSSTRKFAATGRQFPTDEPRLSDMDTLDDLLAPPSMFAHDRSDSNGTRYDVTSFIGGLSAPGRKGSDDSKDGRDSEVLQAVAEESAPSSAIEEHPPALAISTTQPAREEIATSKSPSTSPIISPLSLRSPQQSVLRPLLLGSGAPVPTLSATQVPIASRARAATQTTTRTRMMISVPRPLAEDSGYQNPGLFERPRQPPDRPLSR